MPFLPKRGIGRPGLGVERHHLVSRCDVDNARLAAVGPIRESATRELPRCGFAALAFVQAVHPQHFTCGGVESHYRATRPAGAVENAAHHERRGLQVELRPGTQGVGFESPGDFQLGKVVFVDLVEGRVPGVAQIPAVGAPFTVRRPCPSRPSLLGNDRDGSHRDDGGYQHLEHGGIS